jgi:hypothetical protein
MKLLYVQIIAFVLTFTGTARTQTIYGTWKSEKPSFCLVINDRGKSYIDGMDLQSKIRWKKCGLELSIYYAGLRRLKGVFDVRRITQDTLILKLRDLASIGEYMELNSEYVVLTRTIMSNCACPQFVDCPVSDSQLLEEQIAFCKLPDDTQNKKKTLFEVIDTIQGDFDVVRYDSIIVFAHIPVLGCGYNGYRMDTIREDYCYFLYNDSDYFRYFVNAEPDKVDYFNLMNYMHFNSYISFYNNYIKYCYLDSFYTLANAAHTIIFHISDEYRCDYFLGLEYPRQDPSNNGIEVRIYDSKVNDYILCRIAIAFLTKMNYAGLKYLRADSEGWVYFAVPYIRDRID